VDSGHGVFFFFVIEYYSKFDVRVVVRFLQAEGISQSDINCRVVSVYVQNILSKKEVSVWCSEFEDGRTALNDDPEKYRGRQKTSFTDDKFVTVESLVTEDRRVKVHEIAEVTGIAKKSSQV
jgi:hypothetical protein